MDLENELQEAIDKAPVQGAQGVYSVMPEWVKAIKPTDPDASPKYVPVQQDLASYLLDQDVTGGAMYMWDGYGDKAVLWRYDPVAGVWEKSGQRALQTAVQAEVNRLDTSDYAQRTVKQSITASFVRSTAQIMAYSVDSIPAKRTFDRTETAEELDWVPCLDYDYSISKHTTRQATPYAYFRDGDRLPYDIEVDASYDTATPLLSSGASLTNLLLFQSLGGDPDDLTSKASQDALDLLKLLKLLIGLGFRRTYSDLAFWVFLVSKGGKGKSTFFKYLSALYGGQVSALSLRQLTSEDFNAAALYGKRANLSDDTKAGWITAPAISRLKTHTGGAIQHADIKYEEGKDFANSAKLWLNCNQMPAIAMDEAEKRRTMVFVWHEIEDFPAHFGQGGALLLPELGAFAYECLEHVREYMDKMAKVGWRKALDLPKSMTLALEAYQAKNNAPAGFRLGALRKLDGGFVTKADMLAAFQDYCEDFGYSQSAKMSAQKLSQELKKLGLKDGVKKVDGHTMRGWLDVGVLPAEEWSLADDVIADTLGDEYDEL